MLIDLPLTSNLLALQQLRQQGINKNLLRDNAKRIDHTFQVNDKVWIQEPDPDKLQPRKLGPFPITQVNPNGTVKLQRAPSVVETVNIRKLTPYREPNQSESTSAESADIEVSQSNDSDCSMSHWSA